MKYCKICNKNVIPTKKFSFGWFIVNCIWVIGGLVYIIYFLFFKKKVCPICNGNQLEIKQDIIINNEDGTTMLLEGEEWDNYVHDMKTKAEVDYVISSKKLEEAKSKNIEDKIALEFANERIAESKRKKRWGKLPWQLKLKARKLERKQQKLDTKVLHSN